MRVGFGVTIVNNKESNTPHRKSLLESLCCDVIDVTQRNELEAHIESLFLLSVLRSCNEILRVNMSIRILDEKPILRGRAGL